MESCARAASNFMKGTASSGDAVFLGPRVDWHGRFVSECAFAPAIFLLNNGLGAVRDGRTYQSPSSRIGESVVQLSADAVALHEFPRVVSNRGPKSYSSVRV